MRNRVEGSRPFRTDAADKVIQLTHRRVTIAFGHLGAHVRFAVNIRVVSQANRSAYMKIGRSLVPGLERKGRVKGHWRKSARDVPS